jgi:hypothetical protein
MGKKLDFTQLVGRRIMSADAWLNGASCWTIRTDGGDYRLVIEDDGCGGNDSHAYLSQVDGLPEIIGAVIDSVSEESDSCSAEIKLRAASGLSCIIGITHDHNGYYGFSYELVPVPRP